MSDTRIRLVELIPHGKQNAVKAKQIADILNIDRRLVHKEVERLRNEGVLIASSKGDKEAGSPAGLFIPDTLEEAKEYLNRWNREITTHIETYEKQKDALSVNGFLLSAEENRKLIIT